MAAQLSSIPKLQATEHALRGGYSLLIRPLLDYDLTHDHKFRLNILFAVPQVSANSAFCTLESWTPFKYNLSGVCYTGPLPRDDIVLVTCSDQRYFVKPAALGKCYTNTDNTICPSSLLHKASRTDWLGVAWNPSTKLPFQRYHRRAPDCSDLPPLVHIRARYYFATTTTSIALSDIKGTTTFVDITPLSVLRVPCNTSFDSQTMGLAKCPATLSLSPLIFQATQISYVPWLPETNDSLLQLHYKSLHVLPLLSFDNKTLQDLDNTYQVLDGELTDQIQHLRKNIQHLKPASTPTLTDIFAYSAFAITIFHCFMFIFTYCYFRHAHMFNPPRPCPRIIYTPADQTVRETPQL